MIHVRRRGPAKVAAAALLLAVAAAGCSGNGGANPDELRGRDANNDGVRDDVGAYIATFPAAMRADLTAVAVNEQATLTMDHDAPGAPGVARGLAEQANRLVSCTPADLDGASVREAQEKVRGKVTNTDARRDASAAFQHLIAGQAFDAPDCQPTAPPTTAATR